jgi:hypothetical protein
MILYGGIQETWRGGIDPSRKSDPVLHLLAGV